MAVNDNFPRTLAFHLCAHAAPRLADWITFAVALGREIGYKLHLRPMWACGGGGEEAAPALAYLSAADALRWVDRGAFTPVAMSHVLEDALFVSQEGAPSGWEAIHGKTVAVVPGQVPTALGLRALAARGLRPRRILPAASWLQALRWAREGQAEYALVLGDVFYGLSGAGQRGLTPAVRPLLAEAGHFVVVRRAFAGLVQRVEEALLQMGENTDPEQRALRAAIGVLGWQRPEGALGWVQALLAVDF